MTCRIEDIYNEYGVYTHHFIFGVVGRLTNALLEAHNQGYPLPSSRIKEKDNDVYNEFIQMKEIGVPITVIRAHILTAGLDPKKVLDDVVETDIKKLSFIEELQNGVKLNSTTEEKPVGHVSNPEFSKKLRERYKDSEDAERIEEIAKALNKWETDMMREKKNKKHISFKFLQDKFKKAYPDSDTE